MKLLAVLAILAVPASVSPASPPPPLTPKQIFKLASASSVRIRIMSDHPSMGSGTIVQADKDGIRILTCAHVVHKEPVVLVDFDSEGVDIVTRVGSVEKKDEKSDLAIVRVAGVSGVARPVASVEPELFDELYVVSSPESIMRQSQRETLNTKDANGGRLWFLTGESIPGMSGASVLDGTGSIVCVIQANWRDEDGERYPQIVLAIPLKTVRAFLSPVVPK